MPPQCSRNNRRSHSYSGCTRHHLHSGIPSILPTAGGGVGADGPTSIYQNGYGHLLDCDDEQAAVERATRAFELDAAKARFHDEKDLREFARGVFTYVDILFLYLSWF